MRVILIVILTCSYLFGVCQSEILEKNNTDMIELPYSEIPNYSSEYTTSTIVARMIDGLGFRYHWATESLSQKDLEYQPDETARTSFKTLLHIHSLSETILNVVSKEVNVRPMVDVDLSWEELRSETLSNIASASEMLKNIKDADFNDYDIVFQRGEKTSSFPFWHLINGQIADALWHVGQVVSFRRASGNPIDMNVNVFTGKVKDFK